MKAINDIFDGNFPKTISIIVENFLNGGTTEKNVNAVYGVIGRMPVIICKFNNGYQDFYWHEGNKCFYPLSERFTDDTGHVMTFKDWWDEEEIGVECPKEYAGEVACIA